MKQTALESVYKQLEWSNIATHKSVRAAYITNIKKSNFLQSNYQALK